MSTIQDRVEQYKQNGAKLDFSETFSEAFDIWKNIFAYGALAFFIFSIYSFVIGQAQSLLPFMAQKSADLESVIQSNPGDFEVIREEVLNFMKDPMYLGVTIFSWFLYALIYPIIAGVINMAYEYDKTGNTDVSYLFVGFNGNNFGRLVVLYLLYTLAKVIGLAIAGVGFFIPFVGFSIASCFIIINGMGVMDAIKASFAVTFKNFFVVLFLLLLSYLFGLLGVIACIIGALFTAPMVTIICYAIYKRTIGIDNDQEVDEIGSSYQS